jgi:hypothetical protein
MTSFRRLFVALFAASLTALLLGSAVSAASPAAAPKAPATSAVTVPITGTGANGVAFNGTFNISQFQNQGGQLVAVGTLTGTLTNAAGTVLGTVTNLPVTIPVAAVSGSCQILHLVLGPLDLNLLGLMVHLNQVVLDITAQSGSGNLLGNLLCAVAHLLDSNASTTALANLLNHILGAL